MCRMSETVFMQALNITVLGMLIVFTFLILLICVMKVMGALVQWAEKCCPQAATEGADNALLAVAIAAAKKFQSK